MNIQYQVIVTYTDKTVAVMTEGVEWQVSNDNASITSAGLLRSERVGDVIISATLDSIVAETPLSITDAKITALFLTPTDVSIPTGKDQQYLATAQYNNHTTLDVSNNVAWSSSDSSVATIDKTGLVTPVRAGTTMISATLAGITQRTDLRVYDIGTVVTWGNPYQGGDSSSVQSKLTNVQAIYSNEKAFAALKKDGTVVTWGNSAYGGDSSAVQDKLVNIQTIFSTSAGSSGDFSSIGSAFAALKQDGTVVTWGSSSYGSNSYAVQDKLVNVQTIVSTRAAYNGSAFAALKQDGTVVTWGLSSYGGDSSAVKSQLINVEAIFSSAYAFAALKQDGTVVTWGFSSSGGDSSAVKSQLINVKAIFSAGSAFAALKQDGTVVTWGESAHGGDSSVVQSQLTNVEAIFSSKQAFSALRQDGSVVTWGNSSYGGDSSAVQGKLVNVQTIVGISIDPNSLHSVIGGGAFAALKQDGTVVTWGGIGGGNSSTVQSQLTNVKTIYGNEGSFAALKQDGSVVTWGTPLYGGDSSAVQSQLTNVEAIFSSKQAFAALRQDGSVVTWGTPIYGGDSTAVQSQLTNVEAIFSSATAFAVIKTH